VPAVSDEILSRGEFLTAYTGSRYGNLGSFQAQFEYQSMMAELVDMDVVSYATYDWGTAACSALGMAQRITGRRKLLIAESTCPHRLAQIHTIAKIRAEVKSIKFQDTSGQLDLEALDVQLDKSVAAVYLELPSYLGILETRAHEIAKRVHQQGALLVVGVDPLSLGVLAPPSSYAADIVCGSIQPLGIHMYCGGGLAGFLAMPDDDRYKSQCPWPMLGLLETQTDGEFTFGWVNFDTTSYGLRDRSEDFVGTGQTIWAIIAGVYLALMGPEGMREIGETIMQRCHYAARTLNKIEGLHVPFLNSSFFKEFVVRFEDGKKSVAKINASLKKDGIIGGVDLSGQFPQLGNSALFCVTEIHNKDDIDRLAASLKRALYQ
jgi:glycine dehydrogenase subunit 1